MINFTMKTPIDDVELNYFLLDIISQSLQQVNVFLSCILMKKHFYYLFFDSNNLISKIYFVKM